MKIATWNVNGIRARESQFHSWIQQDHPQIVCLQEIKANPLQVPPALFEMIGYWCYWHGLGGYSGVGLHLSKEAFPEPPVFSHPSFDHETRAVEANTGLFTILSVYVPNGGKDFDAKMRFLSELAAYVQKKHENNEDFLICGDMNVAMSDQDVHPKERKANAIGQRPEERQLFRRILESGVIDIMRTLHPDDNGLYTWWPPWRNMRRKNIGWRLDYVLASPSLASRIQECTVLKDVGASDHAPVVAVLNT